MCSGLQTEASGLLASILNHQKLQNMDTFFSRREQSQEQNKEMKKSGETIYTALKNNHKQPNLNIHIQSDNLVSLYQL